MRCREKTEELDRFFKLSLDLLCIAGTDGYFRRLNRSWETALGYRIEELEGKRFFDFIHPDDIKSTNHVVAELSKGKDVINFINRYRCKDGSYRWIEWRSSSYNGTVIYAAARDITERKRIEEALRESEEKFRSLSDSSPMGVFYTDSTGNILYTNKSFQDITGISYENSLGSGWINTIHPDDRNEVIRIWNQTISKKRGKGLDWRFVTPDGNIRLVHTKIAPIFSEHGELTGFVGTNENITERKLADDALRESEERFRALLENLQDIILILNSEGIVVFENPSAEATLGYSLLGKGFNVVHPDDLSVATDAFNEVIDKENKHIPTQFRIRQNDGSWMYVEALATNLFENSIIKGMLLVCRDITVRMNTQAALQESEERFRALVDNLQDIVLILDSNGIIKFENPSTEATVGFSLLGTNVFEIVHPDDMAAAKKDFMEVMEKTNRPRPSLFRAHHKDGSWLYMEVLATNLFDNSIIQGMMVVCRNVTLRMKTQQALLESEQRYHALFDQSPVGVLQFDTNGIVTDCNERLVQIMRSSREKLVGLDLKSLRQRSVIPNLLEALAGKSSFYEGPYQATTSEAELIITLTVSPLYDDHGNVIGGMGVIDDISDRKAAEEKLKISEERNRLLVENANDSIVVLQNRHFVFANIQFVKLSGYSDRELGLKDFAEFVHPDDRWIIEDRYKKRMEGEKSPFSYELRFITSEGHVKWTELNSVLFIWEGKPAVLLFIRDITERKLAEEERRKMESQIQQTQKLESLGVLAGGIAHDFNNLLMAILGNIDLALLELSPSSQARGNLLEAAKASQRAADLCRQMLAYSGRGRFTSESLSLNEIIEDMSHMLEVSVSKKALLRFNYASGLSAVEADATQVRQIIMNLVINASDAIGEKSGIISISTGMMDCDRSYLSETWLNEKLPEGQYVYIEVADTGCGMDQETLPKDF